MTDRRDVLARALTEIRALKAEAARARAPIAITGLACRLPGAPDQHALWRLLCDGLDATGEPPPGRPAGAIPSGTYTLRGGWLDAVDGFDAAYFGISDREAASLDPQHRLFIELCHEALEDAGLAPDRLAGSRTGVWCGVTGADYAQVLAEAGALDAFAGSGLANNFAAGRVARTFDLRGPALAVDAACASSLVAVHLAVAALRRGEVDRALVGGVNLMLTASAHGVLCQGRVLSRAGRCRTFDAAADGYARAEGGGVVVLERLDDARRGEARVMAVIRGSAVGHDGASSGLMVPSGDAQAAVIAAACADAGIAPGEVQYVEAHGTGTRLGDPIEVRALARALGADRASPLLLGSIKGNVGHLEAAAGIAGLLRATLAIAHRTLPAHVGMNTPNPAIDWARLPVEVVTARRDWPGARPVAGVSAFGASGTDAHVIVTAPDPEDVVAPADDPTDDALLVLSAATPAALAALAGRHAAHIEAQRPPLAAVARTLARGRSALPHALAVVGSDPAAVAARLAAFAAGETALPSGRRPRAPVPVAFLFAGQGGQRPGLGHDLFARPGPFRDAIEHCDALLRPHRREALVDVLYPQADRGLIDETEWTQPALFAVEWALAQQWRAWGVEPAWVLGHSLGAFVAATVAGVMSLDAALALVARRAALMQATAPGAMAAVFAAEEAVAAALADAEVVVTAVNGPAAVVIGGAPAAIDDALARLAAAGLRTRRLAVGRAFHSPLMAPVLADFEAAVARVALAPPAIPFISDCGPDFDPTRPADWRRHLRAPVRFADALATLRDAGCALAVECGPGGELAALARHASISALPSLRRDHGGRGSMLDTLGRLAVAGARCDVAAAHPGRGRLALPGYAFERRRHWAGGVAAAGDPLIGVRRPETDAIVYEATWSPGAAGVLRDHTVHGRVVVSGAVTSAAALAALRAAGVEGRRVVEAVEFTAPLTLDGPRRVELRLVARSGGHDFEVATLDPRRLHLRGRIGHHDAPPPPPVELAAVRARCVETLAGDDFYARFWDPARHHLGPSYRLIETIWRRDGEALARLRPPPPDPGLDATRAAEIGAAEVAGQLLMPAVPDFERVFAEVGHTFLGAGMARSVEHGAGPAVWVYARLGHVDDGGFGGDVALLAADGALCVTFEGLAVRRITEAVVRPTAAAFELGPVAGRRARLLAHLRAAVTTLAGTADPDVDAPLSQLGFDSLMTLDLAERLAGAGLAVGAADALRDLSLDELVDRALATAAVDGDGAAASAVAVGAPESPADGATAAPAGAAAAVTGDAPANARDDGPWRLLGASGGKRRLFCVAHAGAGPLAFAPWRTHLPSAIEARAAALPGHPGGPAGAPLTTVEAVVAHLLSGLRPLLDRPFVLFGASFGGLVAFELARALRREGLPGPARLVVAATAAPDRPHPLPAGLETALGGDVAALVALGLVPSAPGIEAALPALLPALAADLRALRAHAPVTSPIAAPITALGFRGDGLVDRAALAGWAAMTEADCTLRVLDGGHLAWRDHPAAVVDAIG